MSSPAADTITSVIIRKLKARFGDRFRQYYYGDPWGIPVSALPCLIVLRESTKIRSGPTGMDRRTHTVVVKIAVDKTNDFGKSAEESVTAQTLEAWAEATGTDGTYDPQSVMGVIRTDETLSQLIVSQEADVSYQTVYRAPTDTITAEAVITILAEELVPVTRTIPAD